MNSDPNIRHCRCCDEVMEETQTTFTVVKPNAVYVVHNVPCLKCSTCGETVFTQETVTKLEHLASGRFNAQKIMNAWIYDWDVATSEVSRAGIPNSSIVDDYQKAGSVLSAAD